MNNATECTVPIDHPSFAGHFPGTPIFPGVMLLDTVLHAISAANGSVLNLCEISAVKFLSPARPGDTLVIRHSLTENGTIHFDVLAGLRKIASGSIVPESRL